MRPHSGDQDGWFHFAGRAEDRLRVDGENLAAAAIKDILARFPDAVAAAVQANPVSGDQVMTALALREGARFEPDSFAAFLAGQPDLGTKMAPRFIRIVTSMPVTATNKVHRAQLRRGGFRCADPVWWSPPDAGRCGAAYQPLTMDDLAALLAAYRDHGREALLDR